MKYKPCCGRRCLLANCQTRDNGGCYCVCRIKDNIEILESTIRGEMLEMGSLFIPSVEKREEYKKNMAEERREADRKFREEEAPVLLMELKNKLKEYILDE
jgi:hypothetical protein